MGGEGGGGEGGRKMKLNDSRTKGRIPGSRQSSSDLVQGTIHSVHGDGHLVLITSFRGDPRHLVLITSSWGDPVHSSQDIKSKTKTKRNTEIK